MSEPIIQVRGLSKRYRLGAIGATSLREEWHRYWDTMRGVRRTDEKEFWALRDVSFDVHPGEVVGIIGRNGAGKSTLLKILSRITEPTQGRAALHGRVASLLEVGTGFHPELTGRENIFLNGAILGMSRAEVRQKFDEIVAFAEIDRFIDTPVKRYSSGMYVRLAFAVAAHLEPEILIIDEVLAVGDLAFQQKCLGKMKQVAGADGRTVLFVSHNTGAILSLCDRGILLRGGQVKLVGTAPDVIREYLSDASSGPGEYDVSEHPARTANAARIIQRIMLIGPDGRPTSTLFPEQPITITLHCAPSHAIEQPRVAVAIEDDQGRRLFTMASYFEKEALRTVASPTVIRCRCEGLHLAPGRYLISASIGTRAAGLLDSLNGVAWFQVQWHNNYPSGETYLPVYGPILKSSRWSTD